jgi:hypothetical protein
VARTRQDGQHQLDLANASPAELYCYPDAVREWLAKGLFNTPIDAKAEDDLARRDALLDELRTLARGYPDDGLGLSFRGHL